MADLVVLLNADARSPARAERLRRWASIGSTYAFAGVVLRVERVRTGDNDALQLIFTQGAACAELPHHQRFRIGGLCVTPRALLHSGLSGRPVAVLLEFVGDRAAAHLAFEAAA